MSARTIRLQPDESVKFSDLPGLIAEALHNDEDMRALAEMALEDELRSLVDAGVLVVRDPLTLGVQVFPLGNVLDNSILTADDLRPLLTDRGIDLVVDPDVAQTVKPVSRSQAQNDGILAAIRGNHIDPLSMPSYTPGKAGLKAQIRSQVGDKGIWVGCTVFDKAWERLLKSGEIAYKR